MEPVTASLFETGTNDSLSSQESAFNNFEPFTSQNTLASLEAILESLAENVSTVSLEPPTSEEPLTSTLTSFNNLTLPRGFRRTAGVFNRILFWWNVIISPVGIVGNLLCVLVVSQKQNRSISCCIYMGALAIADTLMLIGNVGQIVLLYPLKFAPHVHFQATCQAVYYMMFGGAHCGVMIILALLVERVIAVTRPLQAATLLSPRRAVVTVIALSAFSAVYTIPRILITSATRSDRKTNKPAHCSILEDSSLAVGYNMAGFFVMGVAPFIAIFIMNIIILNGVRASKKKIAKHAHYKDATVDSTPNATCSSVSTISTTDSGTENMNCNSKTDRPTSFKAPNSALRSRREQQMTVMSIVMTTVFLVCTVPRYAHHLTFASVDWKSSQDRYLVYLGSASLTSNLYAMNSAINFYLYVMTGSKFRADVLKLFRWRRK